jgi:S-adenosylmethionine hydrolase
MIISLLTDFGLEDNYVGVMKAVILRINPSAQILDLTHNVKRHNIIEAAFLLKGSFKYFPEGTIFLVVVDPGVGSKRKAIIVKTKDYTFIAPDNGVLSPTLKETSVNRIIEITNKRYFLKPVSDTFHGRDIFSPIAAFLSKGIPLESFGREIREFKDLEIPEVKIKDNKLLGEIIYIDGFGNLISNIQRDIFYDFLGNKKFRIHFKGEVFKKINRSYAEMVEGKPLVIFGSFDSLEISVNRGNAKDYFRAKEKDKIEITRRD